MTTPVPSLPADVVVVGAGAGGLSTAVTAAHHGLRVVVLERADVCGGATAWSGGWMWAPGNPLAHADGVHEDVEQFRTYLRAALGADYDAARVDAFLAAAPEMVRFFHEQTALTFVPGARICDVYGGLPGAGTGHRSVAPAPVDGRTLGDDVLVKLRRQLYETSFLGMGIMAGPDLMAFLSVSRGNPRGLLHATRRFGRHVYDLVTRRRGMQLVNGTALVGRLLRSALDLGVDVRVGSAVTELLRDDDGRVTGVVATTPDGPVRITATRGVVLAAGGFPQDVARRRALFPRTPTGTEHWSLAPATADGAGTTLGESAGGRLRTDVASPAAWCPVSLVPYRSGLPRRWRRTGVFPHIMDRAKPGSIGVLLDGQAVRQRGQRLPRLRHGDDRRGTRGRAGAVVADRRLPVRAPLPAGDGQAAPGAAAALPAQRLPQEGPHARGARPGVRDRPGRPGGDRRGVQPARAPRRGPGVRPGQHAVQPVRRRPGGRRRTRRSPRWRRARSTRCGSCPAASGRSPGSPPTPAPASWTRDDAPVPGLYAVGNDQASVMGGHYPAGGINIGPAMAFGYVAGRDLAGVTVPEVVGQA